MIIKSTILVLYILYHDTIVEIPSVPMTEQQCISMLPEVELRVIVRGGKLIRAECKQEPNRIVHVL